ncbi:MAG: capsule assembly Wzi family protein [Rikenellaceae bacterium]
MIKTILLTFSLLFTILSFSQNRTFNASLETKGLAGSGSCMPFWFTHNQLGKYSNSANWQGLTEGQISGLIPLSEKLKLTYGTDLAFLASDKEINTKIIQAYAGLSWGKITLKAGAFADEEILGGLSASNGNIVRSLNYRPYPMIRLSTSGYIPFLFAKKWFRFKAEYDEGILNDNRLVNHPHLNHNMLAGQFLVSKTLRLSLEVNRYVFWGGRSLQYGQLPDDLESYFRYILGLKGGSGFLETDQINVAGNQLGSYLLTTEKDFENFQLQIRISHPFEDHSGMEFNNLKDNMYSFYITKNKTGSLIDEFLFEYLYTKNQSGSFHQTSGPGKHMRGLDNYFNHGIYRTGFSYLGYSMGTPLFSPLVKNSDGIVAGFENNRISAFHAGAKGYMAKQITWKTMITYSRNFGTYSNPYNPVRKELYSLAEFSWKSGVFPLIISTQLAADFGDMADNQFGLGFSCKWIFR